MKQKIERVIRNKKLLIGLAEIAVVIGCIAIFCLLMIPKDRVPNRTHSYSKMEVTKYKIVDNNITRVMPLTEYETFKEIATTTLNNVSEDANYTLKVYKDEGKTEEVTEGYIASGMIVETTIENTKEEGNTTNETINGTTNQVTNQTAGETIKTAQTYKISVIGDLTGDGDINVTELTKIIKGVVGLTGWDFTDEAKLSADISGDKEVDVVDIELCINYIVFGKLEFEEEPDEPEQPIEPDEPTVKYTVVFKDEDGKVISTNTYEEGATVEIPEAPVKPGNEVCIYKFIGWTPEVEQTVTKDAEYTAQYEEEYFIARVEATDTAEGVSYLTLDEAVKSIGTEARTIRILKDTKESVTIEEGQNITINLNGKTIEGTAQYVINNEGTLVVIDETEEKQGTIKSTEDNIYGIYNLKGNTTFKSGNILSEQYGIYNANDGIVEVGVKDQSINVTTPNISGKINAIYNNLDSTGKINYYDGTLKGKMAIDGGINEIEDNSKIVITTNEEGNEVVTLETVESSNTNVAKIGENEYKTLQEAIEAITENEATTIELIVDFDATKAIEIPQNKNITIDLYGHTITTYVTTAIANKGTLQIIDSAEEGTGKIINKFGIVFNNEGTLTIGTKDGAVSIQSPYIEGRVSGIKNSSVFNFYDGKILGKTTIEGLVSDKENNHCIVTKFKEKSNECYLEERINGNKYETTIDGITWSYRYQDETATDVDYINGTLTEVVTIPSELDGYTVVSINSYHYPKSIFTESSSKSEIKQVIIPPGVTTIGTGLYTDLEGLTDIEVPEWVTNIEGYAFYGCSNVTTIKIPKSVENMGDEDIYGKLTSLINIEVSEENNNYCDIEGVLYSKDKTIIVKCPTCREGYSIPEGVTSIGDGAFSGCSSLTQIVIPDSVTSIGYGAFSGCSSLESVTIGNSVESIEYSAFYECTSLTSIEIPNSVTSIGLNAFNWCYNLADIYIDNEESNISWEPYSNSGMYAFIHYRDCKHTIVKIFNEEGLEIQDVTNNLVDGNISCRETYKFKVLDSEGEILKDRKVKLISDGKFTNSEQIGKLLMPDQEGIYTIENINRNIFIKIGILNGEEETTEDENEIIWHYTCQDGRATDVYCISEKLPEEVIIPATLDGYPVVNLYNSSGYPRNIFVKNNWESNNTVKKVIISEGIEHIGERAFWTCSALESIIIPTSVEILENYAFSNCPVLEEVTIPEGVTVLGECVFESCINLSTVKIPSSVTTIGYGVFNNCPNLSDIYVDNLESDVTFAYELGQSSGFVHYKDCKQNVLVNIDSKMNLQIEGVNTQLEDGKIACGETYQFRVINELGETVINRKVIVTSKGKYKHSMTIQHEMIPNEEGIYTIDNINRDKAITLRGEYQALDENGIIWNYTYEDGKATNVYYERGELGKEVTIPSNLDGYEVVSLYNTSKGNSIFAKAEDIYDITERRVFDSRDYVISAKVEKVIIPDTVISIGDYAFAGCGEITEIEIPNTVTEIGDWAFVCCNSLTDINIPEGITRIGDSTFRYCSSLVNIEIPDSVTTIGESAFQGCTALERINIPDGVTSIGNYAFNECINLISIEIPNGVTGIGAGTFAVCRSLENINIPDSVTSIGHNAFSGCRSLESINIPNSVTSIGDDAFSGCRGLESINIPNSVTSIGERAFQGCTALESINIPDGVTSIGDYAFDECINLISIEIPNSVTGIGAHTFSRCRSLESIKIPNRVTSIGDNAFSECGSLTSIEIPNSVTNIGDAVFEGTGWYNNQPDGVIYTGKILYKYKGEMPENTKIEIEEGIEKIRNEAFYQCTNLSDIYIPDTVTSIGNWAFSSCSSLESIEIPNSVTTIGNYAFLGCDSLTEIEIPDSVTTIGERAFQGCTALERINIPDSVTSVGNYAFDETAWYNNQPDGLIYIGKAIYKYKGEMLEGTSIEIKEGTLSIPEYAFAGYTGLVSISIPDSVTSIGYNAFNGCSNLASINIPEGVTSIERATFTGCTTLTEIELPDSVTLINDYAFDGCSNLRIFTMSKNVKCIGAGAFTDCTSLENIIIWKEVDEVRSRAFRGWKDNQTINLEADKISEGWAEDWNDGCEAKIVYAYLGD